MAGGKPPNIDVKLAAILDAQETMITLLGPESAPRSIARHQM